MRQCAWLLHDFLTVLPVFLRGGPQAPACLHGCPLFLVGATGNTWAAQLTSCHPLLMHIAESPTGIPTDSAVSKVLFKDSNSLPQWWFPHGRGRYSKDPEA
jgi:hypothetical protein